MHKEQFNYEFNNNEDLNIIGTIFKSKLEEIKITNPDKVSSEK